MIGRTLGRYQILELVGEGGMGQVYAALDTQLGRKVAVKILTEHHLARDEGALSRFRREARVVASLSHPNILAIHDLGIEGGVSFAVMELLEGETLRLRLHGGPIPWSEAEEIGLQIAQGMAAAHAKGIVHRDLKPENVFMTREGLVKILDFGLARVAPRAESLGENASTISMLTQPGMIVGTVSYMSPEQVRGDVVDARSDVFAFGSILYEMVTGRKAFERPTAQDTLAAILRDAPPELPKELGLPSGLKALIERCLEKDPANRFASGTQLVEVLSGASAIAAPTAKTSRIRAKRHRVPIWSGAALVAAGAVGSVILFCGRNESIGSLAVLPLVNATGADSLEYLSDGLAESLLDRMSASSSLKVMAWSTVVQYKGKEPEPLSVGKKLNVEALLTGRLALDRGVYRVVVELVHTRDGRRLWAERSESKSLPELEIALAQRLSKALRLKSSPEEVERLSKQHTQNPEAYSLYLKGRYLCNKYTEQGIRNGIETMEKAIEIDPTYALAYAGLASSYTYASTLIFEPRIAMVKSKSAAERALQLDATLGEAHGCLAYVKYAYDWNWPEAETHFKKAIALDPSFPIARLLYGWMMVNLGRFDEGIREMSVARDLDPLVPLNAALLAYFNYLARHYDEALALCMDLTQTDPHFVVAHYNIAQIYLAKGDPGSALEALERGRTDDPNNSIVLSLIGCALGRMGRKDEALTVMRELQNRSRTEFIDPTGFCLIYLGIGNKDQAFAELEKAFEVRSENLLALAVNPLYDDLRGDPRYEGLVRRIGLIQ